MTVRYTGNGGIAPVYECKGRWEYGVKPHVLHVSATIIDKAVSNRLMQVMQPAELELAIRLWINYWKKQMMQIKDGDCHWNVQV